jgi:transcriptional regulator with XRE-family HTH domain
MVLDCADSLCLVKIAEPGDYKDRFATAMELSGKDVHAIAKDLGVTYQAIKKILNGSTKMPRADHSAIAAGAMKVDSVWLATGAGTPRGAHVWPFSEDLLAAAIAADASTQRQLENVARATLGLPTLPVQSSASVSQQKKAA